MSPDVMSCEVHTISYVTFLLKLLILNVIIKKQSDKLRNVENSTITQILQISQCHEKTKKQTSRHIVLGKRHSNHMNLDWNLDDKSKTNTIKHFLRDNWRNLNRVYIRYY